jgi:hypothetical protein
MTSRCWKAGKLEGREAGSQGSWEAGMLDTGCEVRVAAKRRRHGARLKVFGKWWKV